jgi:hypothetical protein
MPESVITEGFVEREPSLGLENPVASAREAAASLRRLTGDAVLTDAMAAGLETFADISSRLVKRILDLRELLDFYELNLLEAPQEEDPLALLAGCGNSDQAAEQTPVEI